LPFREEVARVSLGNQAGPYGYINRGGDFVIQPRLWDAHDFREGSAPAALARKGLRGFIDKSGEFIVQPSYQYANRFSEGLARVTPFGQRMTHFIERSGERAFSGNYMGTHDFQHGLCLVSSLKTLAYIDHEGRTVWEGPYVSGR
ncbi:MAG: WG repeat-containing protein, partial [Acidobacteria bacterium]|nr:WG repeat-containing protein [Acidobacteriota bacterium]